MTVLRTVNEGKQTEQGALILPRMGKDGGYTFTCCDCKSTHRLDFAFGAEPDGIQARLEMRVHFDQAKTDEAREQWFHAKG